MSRVVHVGAVGDCGVVLRVHGVVLVRRAEYFGDVGFPPAGFELCEEFFGMKVLSPKLSV
eukprot:scaffold2933_cov31-Tisochrysis_lutea.AAC.2